MQDSCRAEQKIKNTYHQNLSLRHRIPHPLEQLLNKLPTEVRAQALHMMVEGSSMRSISRVMGISINTVVMPSLLYSIFG